MPECQAKFCIVLRGQGVSTFVIPDPKKDYKRCAQWIHNLGNLKLDTKTFTYSPDKIVCEQHFEKSCFKEDMQAKIMGYTPKRKYLKNDAVPTIFVDSRENKERQTSGNIQKRKTHREKSRWPPWICKKKEIQETLRIMVEKYEDTKGVIRSRKLKDDMQYNGQKKKKKKTNTDLQNTTHEAKDRATRTPHKLEVNLAAPEK